MKSACDSPPDVSWVNSRSRCFWRGLENVTVYLTNEFKLTLISLVFPLFSAPVNPSKLITVMSLKSLSKILAVAWYPAT